MAYFYEATGVTVTWAGVDLSEGWAEDTFLTITPNSARVEHKAGADGQYTFSKLADKGCTITMTFQDVAYVNDEIAAVAAAQDVIGGTVQIAPFQVVDTSGAASFVALNAVLAEVPEITYQKASGERTWTWICEAYILTDDPATVTANIKSYMR